jgi:hypothetical protein
MMELSPVQRRIRDFYFKDGLGAPAEASHVHRANLVPEQRLFSLERLRQHLNNPLLDPNYLGLFHGGKAVDLASAALYKIVQRRKVPFLDRRVLQHYLEQGAARRRTSGARDQRARRLAQRAGDDVLDVRRSSHSSAAKLTRLTSTR